MARLSKAHYDAVIVGAGLVGTTLASLLATQNQSLNIALIDGAQRNSLDLAKVDPRVVAITPASEHILSQAGVWETVRTLRLASYDHMYVWDGEGTADIAFDADDHACLGHIVENAVIMASLYERLQALNDVDTAFETHVTTLERVEAECSTRLILDNDQEITTGLLIAADGGRSTLRDLAGFRTQERDYGHSAIVTTVKTERSHQHTAWQRFSRTGPLAFLPLGVDDKHCSIVWSQEHKVAEQLMALDDDAFSQQLGLAFEYKLGQILHADSRVVFPLKQRHAKHYVKPGIALVGDAAHTIHPLAGQGANLGFYDVAVLAEEITRGLSRGLPISEFSILKRYERRRRAPNQLAMAAMAGFKHLFGSDQLAVRWLRNEGLRQVNRCTPIKRVFASIASGQV